MSVQETITSYCCDAEIVRTGRCSYVCKKCAGQQMLYMVVLSEAMAWGESINTACRNILKEK